METREYDRFVEVCERFLVGCLGGTGVGKTWAARRSANWDLIEPMLSSMSGAEAVPRFSPTSPVPRTAFSTPPGDSKEDRARPDQTLQWILEWQESNCGGNLDRRLQMWLKYELVGSSPALSPFCASVDPFKLTLMFL